VPAPHDAADALAVAICHVHSSPIVNRESRIVNDSRITTRNSHLPRSWRQYRPPAE